MDGIIDHHSHTVRVSRVGSTLDDTSLPFNKEQAMFALIRQLSRYILISN